MTEQDDSAPHVDDEGRVAQTRRPGYAYVSPAGTDRDASQDFGEPCVFVNEVFDTTDETKLNHRGTEWLISPSEDGRYQIRLLAARDSGRITDIWMQRVPPASGAARDLATLLHLGGENASRFVGLLQNLAFATVAHDQEPVEIDEVALRNALAHPEILTDIYNANPDELRALIVNDVSARDVVAFKHRRAQVEEFRRLLDDDAYFERQVVNGRREDVWQRFFENNPWIFGVSLAGQLLTGWDSSKLEQVVVGSSIAGPGKRTDALLRTAGRVQSMVFLEITHHQTHLLDGEYRSGCWKPHGEVVGGVAQLQGTVQRAMYELTERLPGRDAEGADIPGDFTYLLRPRSYLVIGSLTEFVGPGGGLHHDKVKSFELYRRHLDEPEIITFDELYARAEWLAHGATTTG